MKSAVKFTGPKIINLIPATVTSVYSAESDLSPHMEWRWPNQMICHPLPFRALATSKALVWCPPVKTSLFTHSLYDNCTRFLAGLKTNTQYCNIRPYYVAY